MSSSKSRHRCRTRYTQELLVDQLFPEGTVITEVRMDRERNVVEFFVVHEDLPEVNEGLEAPFYPVEHTTERCDCGAHKVTKKWRVR